MGTTPDSRRRHQADDGSPLELKEPVVIDREGNTVFGPEAPRTGDPRVFRLGWTAAGPLSMILVPVLLVGGFLVFAAVAAALLALWLLRTLARAVFGR